MPHRARPVHRLFVGICASSWNDSWSGAMRSAMVADQAETDLARGCDNALIEPAGFVFHLIDDIRERNEAENETDIDETQHDTNART
jgi:hypothetical protein